MVLVNGPICCLVYLMQSSSCFLQGLTMIYQRQLMNCCVFSLQLVSNVELNLNFCPLRTSPISYMGNCILRVVIENNLCCPFELYIMLQFSCQFYFQYYSHSSKVLGLASLLLPAVNLHQTVNQLRHKQSLKYLYLPLLAHLQVSTKWK